MNILLDRLFEMQAELDNQIAEKHKFELNEQDVIINRVTALIVEVAEFTNEVRYFKFWSTNREMRREKALEEYVDCLHFFLSLGNTYGYQEIPLSYPNDEESFKEEGLLTPTVMFPMLLQLVVRIYGDYRAFGYAFMNFLDIGYMLGFSWDEVVAQYEKKYKENQDRQAAGY